jgi:hypothetical protein
MANFKTMKYKRLTQTAALEVDSGARTGRAPVFIPLVVSTLGQMHGFRTLAGFMCSSYHRKLLREEPRSDGVEAATLVAGFKADLRASTLVAVGRGFAQSLLAAGRPYKRRRRAAQGF